MVESREEKEAVFRGKSISLDQTDLSPENGNKFNLKTCFGQIYPAVSPRAPGFGPLFTLRLAARDNGNGYDCHLTSKLLKDRWVFLSTQPSQRAASLQAMNKAQRI